MAKKFDFLSPGIEMREIDQSFIPSERDAEGPIIIGRTRRGPANKPIKVRNLDDFVSVFGAPIPGGGGGDVWREGNIVGTTYAAYAAQAWLASEESPVVMVRLAGEQHAQAETAGQAGWSMSGSISSTVGSNSTAYGLFLVASASMGTTAYGTGSLAAVFYANKGYLELYGNRLSDKTASGSAGTLIKSSGTNCEFTLKVYDESSVEKDSIVFNFDRNSSKYLRSAFSTNPQAVNETTMAAADRKTYWLGESYTREVVDLSLDSKAGGSVIGLLLPLESGSTNWSDHKESAAAARSGYVISQKPDQVDLFVFKCHHVGEDIQRSYMIAIEDIRTAGNPNIDPWGTFTVAVKNMAGQTVEKFSGCNLNPFSPNYISKRVGDQYQTWSETDRRYRTYGNFPNNSDYIYVEVAAVVSEGRADGHLPAGFKGPVRPKGFTINAASADAHDLGKARNLGTNATALINIVNGITGATNTAANSLYGKTLIIDDGVNSVSTFTLSAATGSVTTVTRTAPYTYTVGAADCKRAEGLAGRFMTAINLAFSSGDTLMSASHAPGAVGTLKRVELTSSVAGTFINSKTFTGTLISGPSASAVAFAGGTDTSGFDGVFAKGNDTVPSTGGNSVLFVAGPNEYTASFQFPSLPLRGDGTQGGANDPYRAYYGIRPKLTSTSTINDPDYCDYLRRLPAGVSSYVPTSDYEYSFIFSLDDLVVKTTENTVQYVSGAYGRTNNRSYTAVTGGFGELLDLNVRQFLMPLWGGSEGWDITEKEPLRSGLIGTTRNDRTNYVQYTLNKAIDSVNDAEVVPANLLLMPGVSAPLITNKLISTAEGRKDMLAVIDIENDYTPAAERLAGASEASSLGGVKDALTSFKSRNLNSSYACAFYPWVQIVDNINGGQYVWVPPSIAALGAFGRSQAQSDVWFAPAGFNRGGLGSLGGPRGPSVVQARQRLDSNERDSLYEVNINPIATFPAEGLVIFGQKTLQAGQSALDRINVRRLLLYLKSEVSAVSRNLLFDNNVPSTWARFTSQVNPILSDVKARFGLTDYKLVLDETTTTADLIDRNIMYAKIFIKPARAIEYIVVDFVITRTGADFV